MTVQHVLIALGAFVALGVAGLSAYKNAREEQQRHELAHAAAVLNSSPLADEPSVDKRTKRAFVSCAGFMAVVLTLISSTLIFDRVH